jgi:CO/xanthine dehydrogenase FAD-binding subunit
MQPFELITANTISDAVKAQASSTTAQQGAPVRFIAGVTNLVDFMKLNVETPRQLVDINGLSLDKIELMPDGSVKIGALARNSDMETLKRRSTTSCTSSLEKTHSTASRLNPLVKSYDTHCPSDTPR